MQLQLYLFEHVRTKKIYKVYAENEAIARDKVAEAMDVYMYNLVRLNRQKATNNYANTTT